jgi:hypothetical protein
LRRYTEATSAVEQATAVLESSTSRTAAAEAERNQLSFRLEELHAEQAAVAGGGGRGFHSSTHQLSLSRSCY